MCHPVIYLFFECMHNNYIIYPLFDMKLFRVTKFVSRTLYNLVININQLNIHYKLHLSQE